MTLDTMQSLLVHEVAELHDAERQWSEALPRLIWTARHDELAELLRGQIVAVESRILRLERAFSLLGLFPRVHHAVGMDGLLRAGRATLDDEGSPAVIDASIAATAHRASHYLLAGYQSTRALAGTAALPGVRRLLDLSLREAQAELGRMMSLTLRSITPSLSTAGLRLDD